uniref:Thioredoxin domain-containing protein n=1 Tax=Oxyrrhis marina TaxID=2969 RepID=A0A6U9LMF7_OXYMA|mmetsp:Transcript_2891/g.4511  ORF Transcript_2891/g.4511 Transcript_2891/m.4511 type:complete len:188 (+) Transcript_2891:63-626(+)
MRVTLALTAVASATVELTKASFEESVVNSGKNAFVKFFAPWCGHCKAMKPAWDELATEYEDHPSVLIADVDCTVEQDLCGEFGVSGYPTIKYFTSETDKKGESYNGGRDKAELKKFTEETLNKGCQISAVTECSEKEQAYVEKQKSKDKAALEKELGRLQGMAGGGMAAEKKQWLGQRIGLLKQLVK